MKRQHSIAAALAMAALCTISCQKETDSAPSEVRFSINAEKVAPVKTAIVKEEGVYVPYWQKNDRISVWIDAVDNSPAVFTNSSEQGLTASFSGTAAAADGIHDVFALYPSDAFAAAGTGNAIQVELPASQNPAASSFDPAADILVAVPAKTDVSAGKAEVNSMTFNRCMAVLKIVPADGTTGSILTGESIRFLTFSAENCILAGKATINPETAAITGWTETSSSIAADYGDSPLAGIDGNNAIFLSVAPCTIAAGTPLSFEITTSTKTVSKTVPASSQMVLEGGKLGVINLSLTDENIHGAGESHPVGFVFFEDDFSWIGATWNNSYPKYGMPGVKSENGNSNYNEYQFAKGADTKAAFDAKGYSYNGNAYVHYEGYVKLSTSSASGQITTPAISGIDNGASCSLAVSWNAAPYLNPDGAAIADSQPMTVSVTGGGEILSCGTEGAVIASDGHSVTVPLERDEDHLFFWHRHQIIVGNAGPETRFSFGLNGANGAYRSYVDCIKVEKTSDSATASAEALVPLSETVDCIATPESISEINAAGDNVTVCLRMDRAWTVECNVPWITISSIKTGTSGTAVTIAEDKLSASETGTGLNFQNAIFTVAANTGDSVREGTISFKDTATGTVRKTITVSQSARTAITTCLAKWTMTSVFNSAVYNHTDGKSYTSEAYETVGKPWTEDMSVPSDVVAGGLIYAVNGSGKTLTPSTATAGQWWNRLRLKGVDEGDGWAFKVSGVTAPAGAQIQLKNVYLGCANASTIPTSWELQYSLDGTVWTRIKGIAKPSTATDFVSLDASVEIPAAISSGDFCFRIVATAAAATQSNSIPYILAHPDTATGNYTSRTKLYTTDTDYAVINLVTLE